MKNRADFIIIFVFILTVLFISALPAIAMLRVAVFPWHCFGNGETLDKTGAEIQYALSWGVKNDFQVEVLERDEIQNYFNRLGFRIDDNWNLAKAGQFLSMANCDFLLMGNAFLQNSVEKRHPAIAGSAILIKRSGYNEATVVFKEKISGARIYSIKRGIKNKNKQRKIKLLWSKRSFISKILMKLETFFSLKKQPYNLYNQRLRFYNREDIPLDIAWCIDTSGSMLKHKKQIELSMEKVWYKYNRTQSHFKLRFALLPYNNRKNIKKKKTGFGSSKSSWKRDFYKLSFRGKGRSFSLQDALNKGVGQLSWKQNSSGLKIIIIVTDGGNIGERLTFTNIFSKFKEKGIRIFTVGYPGLDKDSLQRLQMLAGKTGGILEHVIVLSRGYSANENIDLAYYGGNWYQFFGPGSLFNLTKALELRQKMNRAGFIDKANIMGDNIQSRWRALGYYPVSKPESVYGRVGIFKKYLRDEKFKVVQDGANVPSWILAKWTRNNFPAYQEVKTEKVLLSDGEVASWISVPENNRNLLQRLKKVREKGVYIWLGCRLFKDKKSPFGYVMDPFSLQIFLNFPKPPGYYTIKLKDPIKQTKRFTMNGLGKSKMWYFLVKVKSFGKTGELDIRDFSQ